MHVIHNFTRLAALERIFHSFCYNYLQGTPSLKEDSATKIRKPQKGSIQGKFAKEVSKQTSWGNLHEIDRDNGVIAEIRP
jgi:hypothetical protein